MGVRRKPGCIFSIAYAAMNGRLHFVHQAFAFSIAYAAMNHPTTT